MNINKLTAFSNQNFTSNIKQNLKDEINEKRYKLQKKSSKKRNVRLPKFDSYIKEIQNTLLFSNVQIDTKDPTKYSVQYKRKIYKIPRGMDGVYYQYTNLRNGLKDLEKRLKTSATQE